MKNERDVKQAVRKVLDALAPDCWYFMPVPTGYGRRGVPDFIGCYRGAFFAIETKFGKNKPSPHQLRELGNIGAARGKRTVITEDGTERAVRKLLGVAE